MMPSSRVRRPELRIELDGLAIVGDAVLVAAVEHQMVRDERVAFAVGRIDLRGSSRASASGERSASSFDGGVNGHGVERVGRETRAPRRPPRWLAAVSESSRARLAISSWASTSFGSSSSALRGPFDGLAVEAVGADEREAEIGLGVLRIALQGFLEKIFGVGVVEALVQQAAPAHAVERVAVGLRRPRRGTRCWPPGTCSRPQ